MHTQIRLSLFALLCGGFALLMASQSHAQTGFVTGQITDARTGAPVAGATVQIGSIFLGGFSSQQSMLTAADGRYEFEVSVSASRVVLVSAAAPLLPTYWPSMPCLAQLPCGFVAGQFISVQSGETFVADVALSPPGSMSGRVLADDTGLPLAGINVFASWRSIEGSLLVDVLTDAQGDFQVDGLPPGEYRVWVEGGADFVAEVYDNIPCNASCFGFYPEETPVAVVAEHVRAQVDFSLATASVIAGSVSDNVNPANPVSVGVQIQRLTADGLVSAGSTITSQSPEFAFTGLRAGNYVLNTYPGDPMLNYANEVYNDRDCLSDRCTEVEIAAGDRIILDAGETADVGIGLDPAASVSGCISDAATAAPLANVDVVAYEESPGLLLLRTLNMATTGADGCYRIDYLRSVSDLRLRSVNQAGFVDEVYQDVACLGGTCDPLAGISFPLSHDQDLASFDMALVEGVSLGGVVVPQFAGAVLENITVFVHNAQGSPVRNFDSSLRARSDGRFQSYALVDGVYYLSARYENTSFLYGGEVIAGMAIPVLDGTPITIENGQSVDDVVFPLRGAQILANGFEAD